MTEFKVNDNTAGDQWYPTVVGLNDGGFAVTWGSYNGVGDVGTDVYVRRYDTTGSPVGLSFKVNDLTVGSQSASAITGLNNGGLVIAWDSYGGTGDIGGNDVYARRYDTTGSPVDLSFKVNDLTAGSQLYPAVAGYLI